MTTVNTLLSGGQGTAVPSGYIGEVKSIIQAASLNIASNVNYTNVNSTFVTVTPGVWRVFCRAGFVQTAAVTLSEGVTLGYSTDSAATFTDFDATVARSNTMFGTLPAAVNVSITNSRSFTGGEFGIITVLSNTNYYFKISNRVTAGSLDIVGAALYFVRIA